MDTWTEAGRTSPDNGGVYAAILDMIRAGEFHGGEPLRESRLASRIGVSRTPVREALRRLAAEGLVELKPNRGARLVDLDDADIIEVFDLRSQLEPYAAARAAHRITAEDLERMRDLLQRMDDVVAVGRPHLDELARLNDEFHGMVLSAAGSRLLSDAMAVAARRPLVQRTFHRYTPAELNRSQQHHHDLLAALAAGNADWAQSVMRSHIEAARSIYIDPQGRGRGEAGHIAQ